MGIQSKEGIHFASTKEDQKEEGGLFRYERLGTGRLHPPYYQLSTGSRPGRLSQTCSEGPNFTS